MHMKKIFTLLFCVAAMTFAANANTNYERCIEFLLQQDTPARFTAANLVEFDVNLDGVINIDDVTAMIAQMLDEKEAARANAPRNNSPKVQEVINDMLNDTPPVPTMKDLTDTINEQIKKE